MRIGKNELAILEYLREYNDHHPSYRDIQEAARLGGYSDTFLRKRTRARYIEWKDELGGYEGVYKHIKWTYDRQTRTNRVKFSQAMIRLRNKGLVKEVWEIDLEGMDHLLFNNNWSDMVFYSDSKTGIYEKKYYEITDEGREELWKRRKRLVED